MGTFHGEIGIEVELCTAWGFSQGTLCADSLHAGEIFLAHYPRVLAGFDFAAYAVKEDNLLRHRGFPEIWPNMPDARWRCHLYGLQFARMPDLAHAYIQYAAQENDRELEGFLALSKWESNGSPHHWMDRLRQPGKLAPFAPDPA